MRSEQEKFEADAVKALLNCSTATAYELTEKARQAVTAAHDAEIAALKADGAQSVRSRVTYSTKDDEYIAAGPRVVRISSREKRTRENPLPQLKSATC